MFYLLVNIQFMYKIKYHSKKYKVKSIISFLGSWYLSKSERNSTTRIRTRLFSSLEL